MRFLALRRIVRLLVGVALVLACSPAYAKRGEPLNTQQGVLTLGGRFAFELAHVNPDGGNSQTGLMLNLSPSFGGFVIKNLLLEGALGIRVGLGSLFEDTAKTVAFSFGLQYLFNFRHIVVPYLGLRLGPSFAIPRVGDAVSALSFILPAGILISLNQHVGLVIGTELSVTLGLTDRNRGTLIGFPMGYLGVNAYF